MNNNHNQQTNNIARNSKIHIRTHAPPNRTVNSVKISHTAAKAAVTTAKENIKMKNTHTNYYFSKNVFFSLNTDDDTYSIVCFFRPFPPSSNSS